MIDDLVSDVTGSPPVRRVFYPRPMNFLKLATTYTNNARDHGDKESGLRVATATRTSLAYQNRGPYPGCRDPGPEGTLHYIRPTSLLLRFPLTDPVPAPMEIP